RRKTNPNRRTRKTNSSNEPWKHSRTKADPNRSEVECAPAGAYFLCQQSLPGHGTILCYALPAHFIPSRSMVEYLYSHLPPLRVGGKKVVGRVVFSLLIVAAATIGALAGLLLVYSTDLPQVSDLERFRPSATTELYDQKGHIIGTFALQ